MPMEQETMGMLIGGFSIIMSIAFIVVILLMFSKKRKSFRVAYNSLTGEWLYISYSRSIFHSEVAKDKSFLKFG